MTRGRAEVGGRRAERGGLNHGGHGGTEGMGSEHPTFNIEHPTSNGDMTGKKFGVEKRGGSDENARCRV